MEKEVEQKIKRYIQKSRQILKEQQALFKQELYAGSVSRGYYAIFNLACAILLTQKCVGTGLVLQDEFLS